MLIYSRSVVIEYPWREKYLFEVFCGIYGGEFKRNLLKLGVKIV